MIVAEDIAKESIHSTESTTLSGEENSSQSEEENEEESEKKSAQKLANENPLRMAKHKRTRVKDCLQLNF